LATPDRVEPCLKAGLDSLKFSFNSADGAQFQEITGVKAGDFRKIVENLKAARRLRDAGGYTCGIYASSILYDGEQLLRMKEAVAEILPFVDEHYWLPLYGQAGLTAGEHGTHPVAGNPGRVGALRKPLPCWALFTEGHITYDGRLSACCFDHDGRFHMGDLTTQSFAEAWQSAPFQKLRAANLAQDVKGTACEHCIAYD
jgi:radical SAM protein with 4Fe4S-binding SPASM domain